MPAACGSLRDADENGTVEISNPDRIVFPDVGLTKGEVVRYYAEHGDRLLPHVRGRPLTLERYPRGLGGDGFMQKHAPKHFPAFIERIEVPRRDGVTVHAAVSDAAGLAYLANHGTITFHIPTVRLPDLWRPDRLVFDLDPAPGDGAGARRGALAVRDALAALGIPSAPMTTGSKGYHVVTVLEPTLDLMAVGRFGQVLSALVVADQPDLLTSEFRIERREGRVFVDWLRNRPGQTGVAPWSIRARSRAPIAVPVAWDALEATEPDAYTLSTSDAAGLGDPLAAAAATPVDIAAAVAAVEEVAATRGIEIEPFDRFRS
jgi:bifunctional non-homologous end joining protein LigD